jgi:hypothetical protein
MNEQPSYNAAPGQRWGNGSATVLRFLLRDLAQKPAVSRPAGTPPAARRELVSS